MSTRRERLPRDEAKEAYVRSGQLEVFRQLERDASVIDTSMALGQTIAVGPFGRVNADAVVHGLGKTRGAINHLWGNQEAFRAAIMHLFLDDTTLGLHDVKYPDPVDCSDVDVWIDLWAEVEIERGPRHEMTPETRYGMRWAAWLGLVPYGIWSNTIADASMREYRAGIDHFVTDVLGPALARFELTLVDGFAIEDLAIAASSTIEGHWLNSALTTGDPIERTGSITMALATSLRLVIRGATHV
jgi:hypothetical protein